MTDIVGGEGGQEDIGTEDGGRKGYALPSGGGEFAGGEEFGATDSDLRDRPLIRY